MKLNNKGFALTSIIYMLIVLFLMIMLLVLSNLAQRKVVLDKIKNDVKNELNQGGILASNSMIVTFDPQGGQVNQTTKQVTYNEPYGELPTPTREGYVFKGWRGKNLLNMKEWLEPILYVVNGNITKDENSIIVSATNDDAYTYSKIERIYIEPNTEYTLSWESNNNNSGRVYVFVNSLQTTGYMFQANNNTTKEITFTTPADAKFITLRVGVMYAGDSITYSNIQLERGGTVTDYEPYQEYASDTITTKQENHTLYSILYPKYTIVYNGNGATSGTTESSIHSFNEYKALTPNGFEKTGYTFLGWSTNPNNELITIIDDSNEYSYDNTESSAMHDIKSYTISPPFEEDDKYQLLVNVKGSGILRNYFYGASGYLRVKTTLTSDDTSLNTSDGANEVILSDEYTPYSVSFSLGSNGDGSINKYLLFRSLPYSNIYFKNIRFYKADYPIYADNQIVRNLSTTPGETINLYAIWKANE